MDRRIRARVVGPPRPAVLAAVTDAMAPLNAEPVEPDGAAMAATVLAHARQRCLVVLLTDLNRAALAENLPTSGSEARAGVYLVRRPPGG